LTHLGKSVWRALNPSPAAATRHPLWTASGLRRARPYGIWYARNEVVKASHPLEMLKIKPP
jgi:hypothetical protein